jgi:hypothetical protein
MKGCRKTVKGFLNDKKAKEGYTQNQIAHHMMNILCIEHPVGDPENNSGECKNKSDRVTQYKRSQGDQFFKTNFRI